MICAVGRTKRSRSQIPRLEQVPNPDFAGFRVAWEQAAAIVLSCSVAIGSVSTIAAGSMAGEAFRSRFSCVNIDNYFLGLRPKRLEVGATEIRRFAFSLEEAIGRKLDLSCDAVICGADNNPARVTASRYFREIGIPVIFTAVSFDGDHGYVFVQGNDRACIHGRIRKLVTGFIPPGRVSHDDLERTGR